MEFLTWQIVWRSILSAPAGPLPRQILTVAPGFAHASLPPEVGLLLPSGCGSRQLVENLSDRAFDLSDSVVGYFLADPFFAAERERFRLQRAKPLWICNLPTVAQQDPSFTRQLTDVGLDQDLELARLAALKELGFKVAVAVVDGPGAVQALAIGPEALFVLPRIGDFAAGFPSLRQRGAAAQQVAAAAEAVDWRRPIIGLADASEAAYEGQWPAPLSGLLCRPRVLNA